MTYIDDLMNELCPDGVEWKELGEILVKGKGTKITASKMKELHKENAPVRIFAGGKTYADVNYDDIPQKDIHTEESIIVKSRGVIEFEYYTKPFSFKNEFWSYRVANKGVNLRYVYYYLNHHQNHFQNIANNMQMPQISSRDTEKFKIPVPPLQVQEEIVKILDKFTNYLTELTAELTAELTKRMKQYSFYRDRLLSFKDAVYEVEWKTIGDISKKVISGGTPKKGVFAYYDGDIPWLRTQEVDFKEIYSTELTITEEGLASSSAKWVNKNAIIVAMYGATAGKVGIAKIPLTTNQACCNIEVDEGIALYRFVYHWLSYNYQVLKGMGQGSQSNINAKMIREFKIPVPSLEVQSRIVQVLDQFDAVCNDLNIGLPKEIELRQKQYEYFREKLLTFAGSGIYTSSAQLSSAQLSSAQLSSAQLARPN